MEIAKLCYPDNSGLQAALRVKAAVGAGAILTSHWADDLVPYNVLQGDFIEYLRPGSIVGKFGTANPGGGGSYPSLNRVPFNIRTTGASAGTTGYWVQEGLPIPVSKMTTFNTTLTWAKVGGLAALTQEEVRFSNPAADEKVRDDIARALNARVDIDFVDPAKVAVANVSPASITDGVVATTPTGTAATNVRKDLAALLALFATNNLDPSDLVLIMSATMAAQVSMMVNTLGQDDFPSLMMNGGRLRGIPVIVSEHLTSVGSPSTQSIIMVKASEIFLADDGAVTVDASTEASVEMLDSALVQTGIVGTGASLVSAFQSGLLFIKATREITWKVRRSTAVQYLSPVAYVAA
jgi:HK97 family phage major capsid protein